MVGQSGGTFPQLQTGGKTVGKPKGGGHKKITGSMGTGTKKTPCNY